MVCFMSKKRVVLCGCIESDNENVESGHFMINRLSISWWKIDGYMWR